MCNFVKTPYVIVTAVLSIALAQSAIAAVISPVSGLILGLDATDVTLDSGNVSSWNDQSGNSNDAAQVTASARPTVLPAATVGGTDVLSFDGNDYLDTAGSSDFEGNQLTWYLVLRQPTTAGGGRVVNGSYADIDPDAGTTTYGGQAWAAIADIDSSNRIRTQTRNKNNGFQAANVSPASPDELQNDQFYISGNIWDGTTETNNLLGIIVNGNNDRFTEQLSYADNALLQGHVRTRIGGASDFDEPFDDLEVAFSGDIAELLVYDRVLSESEQGLVESYLYQKHFVPEPSCAALLLGLCCAILGTRRRNC